MEAVTIAAIITAVSTLAAGGANLAAGASANKKNLKYAEQERQDILAGQKLDRESNKKSLALTKKNMEFNQNEAILNRQEGLEQKGYGRMQANFQRGADLLTQQMNMNQVKAAPFQKYAGGR